MTTQTPFYQKHSLAIHQEYNRLDRDLLTPWSFMTAMPRFNVTNCEGRSVNYSGIEFDGSAQVVFWGGFFEPDFRKVITEQMAQTLRDCEGYPDLTEAALDETAELLKGFVTRAYERMAEFDRRLRGKGYPDQVEPTRVESKIEAMKTEIDGHIRAAKRLSAMSQWRSIMLEKEQKDLLITLAEAARNVPQDQRQPFRLEQDRNTYLLSHPGLAGQARQIYDGDLRILREEGLIDVRQAAPLVLLIDVKPKGFAYYSYLKRETGQPVQRVETEMRQYIDSMQFRGTYPEAYRKWTAAEDLLWGADSDQQLTTVGHHCREAMQEFADALIKRHNPPDVDPDKARTNSRLKSVVNLYSKFLGERKKISLDTLVDYWEAVGGLVQRQVHGMQKREENLVWEDARRVVFQTLVVMFEIDRTLSRVAS